MIPAFLFFLSVAHKSAGKRNLTIVRKTKPDILKIKENKVQYISMLHIKSKFKKNKKLNESFFFFFFKKTAWMVCMSSLESCQGARVFVRPCCYLTSCRIVGECSCTVHKVQKDRRTKWARCCPCLSLWLVFPKRWTVIWGVELNVRGQTISFEGKPTLCPEWHTLKWNCFGYFCLTSYSSHNAFWHSAAGGIVVPIALPVQQLVVTGCCRRDSTPSSGPAGGRSPSDARSRRTARQPWSCSWPRSPWRGSPSPRPAPGPHWGTPPARPPGPPCSPPAPPEPAGTWNQTTEEHEWREDLSLPLADRRAMYNNNNNV